MIADGERVLVDDHRNLANAGLAHRPQDVFDERAIADADERLEIVASGERPAARLAAGCRLLAAEIATQPLTAAGRDDPGSQDRATPAPAAAPSSAAGRSDRRRRRMSTTDGSGHSPATAPSSHAVIMPTLRAGRMSRSNE